MQPPSEIRRDNTGKKHKCFSNGRKVSSLFHPHTNMAKAALNMLTHTSGTLAKDGIFMNAVDTGWVTDEDLNSQKKQELEDFQPPLDIVDGAARVMDPCLMVLTPENIGAEILKDYNPYLGNTLGLLFLSHSMCSCS
jgi:NAD(P)-dependent dehydrogenase (short-subunit alcohol dehydrogenase family)